MKRMMMAFMLIPFAYLLPSYCLQAATPLDTTKFGEFDPEIITITFSGDTVWYSMADLKQERDLYTDGIRVIRSHGITVAEMSIINGELHGPYKLYYENGRPHTVEWFNHEEQSSMWIEYDSSGVLRSEQHYDGGKPFGIWKYWNESGVLVREEYYDKGVMVKQSVYKQ
jgi:antitoxin component YwqK of YwqJK toxin-antitoxin module